MRKVFYFRLEILGKFGFDFCVGNVIIGIGLGIFGPLHQLAGPNPNTQFFVCFFYKESRQKSASLETLIGFLAFMIYKLWKKSIVG